MPDPITLLGRLLSDPIAHPLPADGVLASIGTLDHRQIQRQSKGLISKRWHEVRLLAPRTVQSLGCDGYARFAVYARSHWPDGARRHPLDALAFLRHLASENTTINKSELRMLRVMCGEQQIAIGWDRSVNAVHLCWRGSSGQIQQRWIRGRLWSISDCLRGAWSSGQTAIGPWQAWRRVAHVRLRSPQKSPLSRLPSPPL